MPLNDYNPPLQQSSGTFTGTTGSATLPAPTTAGNTVILVASWTNSRVVPTAAGFVTAKDLGIGSGPVGGIYYKSNVGAESSWTLTASASAVVCWATFEFEGLDLSNPVDVIVAGAVQQGTTASLSTGTTAMSSTFDGLVIAVHACLDNTDGSSPGTWSGHTGGLTEVIEQGGSEATRSLGMSVSMAVPALSLATWSCTATKTAPTTENSFATCVVFTAAGAKRAADPAVICGFEWGTASGMATGAALANSIAPVNALVGSPAIVTTNPRSGTYCLELSSSAAAESVQWLVAGSLTSPMAAGQHVSRWSVYFPTSLPSVDTPLWTLDPSSSGTAVVVRYINSSQKLGVKIGTGTEQVSDAVMTANTWISVDLKVDGRTTAYTGDWRVRYSDATDPVVQTQATMAGATVANAQWNVRAGWTTSITQTVRFDDIVISGVGGHYPLGDYNILPINVDTGGTLTVSGVTTNWNTFTNNGTMAAWNATTAMNNIDEQPPTLGASADGFAQVVNSTTAYVEIPLTTLNAAQNHGAARGVRLYACTWAATTTASTMGMRAHDGVGEMTLLGDTDVGADSSTTPAWIALMVRGVGRQDWTQTKLDALTARVGFSGDTSPNIGIHSIMGEVALRIGDLVTVLGPDAYGGMLQERYDPDTSGIISFVGTAAPDRDYTLTWEILGVAQTPVTVTAGDVHEEFIGATGIATITALGFNPV